MAKIIPINGISATLIGETIGSSSRDIGTLCSHPNINMWAKYKPVRYNSVTTLTRSKIEMLEYGLTTSGTNIPSEPSFSITSPHYIYRKPRGYNGVTYFEPFRMGDFLNPDSTIDGTDKTLAGYNHEAECFIIDDTNEKRLSFNKIFELQSSVTGGTYGGKLDMSRILNTSPNVEITADFLNAILTWESYVGVFFYNVTTGIKFYNVYKVKWSELATSTLSWTDFFPTNVSSSVINGGTEWPEHFYLVGDQMPINNGDTIHVYYCSVPLQFYNSLGQPDQWRTNAQSETYWKDMFDANQVINFITVGLQDIQVIAPTAINGHGKINVSKFDFMNNNHLSLYNKLSPNTLIGNQLVVNVSRNASGTVECSFAKIPLSAYYFSLLLGYNTSLVTPEVTIDFEVKANGVTLLRNIVTKHFNSTYKEVSISTPSDGSVNFYISTNSKATKATTNIPTTESAVIYFTMKARGVSVSPSRTLVSGTCTISTGGVQTWYFNQV